MTSRLHGAFEDADGYRERRYLSAFDDAQFKHVARRIDREVLVAAGYRLQDIARAG